MIYKVSDMTKKEKAEYENYLQNHKRSNFQQSIPWGEVKDLWEKYLILQREKTETTTKTSKNNKIKASMMLWIRKIPFLGNLIYISRGPVILKEDINLLDKMVEELKEFSKENKVFAVIAEPDIESDEIEIKEKLEELGFDIHGKLTNMSDQINPNYVFRLNLKDKDEEELMKSFASKTRYNIRYAKKKNVEVYEAKLDELKDFQKIMEITGKRNEFVVRNYEYYKTVLEKFNKENVKLILTKHENEILSGMILILYGNKVWYLYGASSNNKRNLMPNYLMQWYGINKAKEFGAEIYDFMGVPGILDDMKEHPEFGLYRFKKGFGSDFTEFIGQVVLPINKFKLKIFLTLQRFNKKHQGSIGKVLKLFRIMK